MTHMTSFVCLRTATSNGDLALPFPTGKGIFQSLHKAPASPIQHEHPRHGYPPCMQGKELQCLG